MGCSETRSNENKVSEALGMTKDQEFKLYESIVENDTNRFTELINSRFDINTKMKHFAKRTLLHIAFENGSVQIVNILVQKSCKLDIKDEYGMTPMFLSIVKEQKECLRILQRAGAKLDYCEIYSEGSCSLRSINNSTPRMRTQRSIKL